jgi:hypothetical protein
VSPMAATATSLGITTVQDAAMFILFLAGVTLGYLGWCYVSPFARCRRCDGNGKERTRTGRAWKPCRRCHGDGARMRLGRHVVNYLRAAHRDASQATRTRAKRWQ